jgi:hypothetical protein
LQLYDAGFAPALTAAIAAILFLTAFGNPVESADMLLPVRVGVSRNVAHSFV